MEETSFVGGNPYILTFNLYESDGINPLTITGGVTRWFLYQIGQADIPVLYKEGIINGTNSFYINLSNIDTETLSGMYVQQTEVIINGNVYRPSQGRVFIQPKI